MFDIRGATKAAKFFARAVSQDRVADSLRVWDAKGDWSEGRWQRAKAGARGLHGD